MSDSFEHGGSAYRNHGCRCPVCTEGNRLYGIAYRRRRGVGPRQITGRTHGLISTYKHGCRCDDCRRAAAVKRRERRYATGECVEPSPERRKYA